MRLIDADEVYKVLTDYYHHKTEIQHKALKEAIGKVPTIDAVEVVAKNETTTEVVRCKDCVHCKHFNDVWYLPKRDELLCTRCIETYHTTENDYCSRGERREKKNVERVDC